MLDQSTVKHKIRPGGIDAPEKKQAFGNKSKQNLASLVAGKYIEVEYNKRDQHGRILGKLIKDGQDINLLQIKHVYAGQREVEPVDPFANLTSEVLAE